MLGLPTDFAGGDAVPRGLVAMKILKLLFAGIAALASMAVAKAADIVQPRAVKTPAAAAPMPAFSWTGCHVGIHAGGGRGEHTVNTASRSSGAIVSSDVRDFHTDGAIFGGQIGCDQDFANGWVVGLEGDFAGAHLTGKSPDPFSSAGSSTSIQTDAQWLASVTGRLGYSGLFPQTLLYVKGGGAWVHEELSVNTSVTGLNGESDKTRSGWTVGGGVAWAFARNWSVFVEYNHYDFGNSLFSRSVDGGLLFSGRQIDVRSDGKIDAVKVGLNFRFGG